MYVKWNSTKYHALGGSGYMVTTLEDGKKRVSGNSYGGEVRSVRTLCGSEIPADNECFNSLPEGADPRKYVCYKCDVGVGAAKIDHVAEQARKNEEMKALADNLRRRMNASARRLFDEL